jgi:hypothetical protein
MMESAIALDISQLVQSRLADLSSTGRNPRAEQIARTARRRDQMVALAYKMAANRIRSWREERPELRRAGPLPNS